MFCTASLVRTSGARAIAFATSLAALASATTTSGQSVRYYRDDPIVREPESQDASQATVYNILDIYEMTYNLFVTPTYTPTGARARNINTIDEVPDSSWFTNRLLGGRQLSVDALVRGPNVGDPPDPSTWTLIREKSGGAHPGFTARDAKGQVFFLEFDPTPFPEGATASVVIATKFFHALGYNQVETFLTTFDPRKVQIDPKATVKRPNGARTPFTQDDINQILEAVHQNPDGTYRVVAGRLIPGKILGNFAFEGTRPDDPNDVVAHEHRRELRALRVFGAWTNLTDLKSANTLDALASVDGRMVVRHYLQDVGSTFGLCNDLHEWDLSWEHFYQGRATLKRFFTLGFALSPWQTVRYNEYPSIGKFEGDVWDPRTWRPQTPTRAIAELRADDAFWAARRVAAFSDEMIRAAVHTGQFSDPAAEKELADVLIKRRDKIARIFLTAINPVVDPAIDGGGKLTFGNAAVDAGVSEGPVTYHATWSAFDNATGTTTPIADTHGTAPALDPPPGLPTGAGAWVAVDISADSPAHPAWKTPVQTVFRRDGSSWKLVSLRRQPDTAPSIPYKAVTPAVTTAAR